MSRENEQMTSEEINQLIEEFKETYGEDPLFEEENYKSYKERAREKEEKIYAMRTNKKKSIATKALVVMCGSLLAASLAHGAKVFKGSTIIAQKYSDELFHDVGFFQSSEGYVFNIGTEYIEYEDMVNILKNRYQKAGISPTEAYITIERELTSVVAKDVVGKKPARKEMVELKLEAAEGKLYMEDEVVSRGK